MIAVDTSALIAILRHEAEADAFIAVLAAADRCLLSSVNLLEVSIVLAGPAGGAKSWTRLDELVADAGIEIVQHDTALAHVARKAFLAFGKGRHKAALNMCDCASYALAFSYKIPLLFKGNDFAKTDILVAA